MRARSLAAIRRRQKKAPSGAAPEGAKSDEKSEPSRCAPERNDDDYDHEGEAEGRERRFTGRIHERAARKGEYVAAVKAAKWKVSTIPRPHALP
jgi:hypothetical protein